MDTTGENRSALPREPLPGVLVFRDGADVAHAAARRFVDCAWQAIARQGQFSVALSGGTTPRELFRLLASSDFRSQVDWPRVHIFWGDERAVPPESEDSNYGMARRELLIRVPVPLSNVHRMEADSPQIGRAAHNYESVLRKALRLDDRGFPILNLLFLGMGPDGHTASLFPGSPLLRETTRWVSTPIVAKMNNARRMTLTLPVLEAADTILFLVTGADKAPALRDVLSNRMQPPLPAQMVQPHHGKRMFLIDEAAASLLDVSAPPAAAKPVSKP